MTDEQKAAMRKGSERPYYACRWVCQKDASQCFGYFMAKDVRTYPCPLAVKCLNDKHPGGQLERKFKVSRFNKLISDSGMHRKEHHDRMRDLQRAFNPEAVTECEHRCYVKTKQGKPQKNRHKSLSELIPGYTPANTKPIPPPPCGGDCEENCPYDGECRYKDWDEEHSRTYIRVRGDKVYHESRENMRRSVEKREQRRKARMAADPVFAEGEREKGRKRSEKHTAKVKFVMAGGTLAQFETIWAKAEGDRDVFVGLCEKAGIEIKWKRKSGGGSKAWSKR